MRNKKWEEKGRSEEVTMEEDEDILCHHFKKLALIGSYILLGETCIIIREGWG